MNNAILSKKDKLERAIKSKLCAQSKFKINGSEFKEVKVEKIENSNLTRLIPSNTPSDSLEKCTEATMTFIARLNMKSETECITSELYNIDVEAMLSYEEDDFKATLKEPLVARKR